MKTHVIQLEPYDDVTTVRDKMAWGKSARILLVWPEAEPHILNRRLDLVLIQRRAQELGSQLALVTRDADVHFYANDLSMPVFRDITRAQSTRWLMRKRGMGLADDPAALPPIRVDVRAHRPRRKTDSYEHIVVRLLALLAGLLAVLAIAGVFIPRAQISLTPEVRTQTLTFEASTGPNIRTLNAAGAVPVRALTVVVEGRQSVPATGIARVPAESATGFVLFSNLTTETVRIDIGSIVLTGGSPAIRYVITQSGVLDAEPGATVLLPVQAVQAGESGNVPAGAVVAIEGLLGLQLTVTNPEAITGGSSLRLSAPTDLDRSLAARQLKDSLRMTAAEELLAQLNADDILLSETPFLLNTQQESYLPADNSPSDLVEATLRLEFQLLTIPWRDVERLAQVVLDAGLEPGFEPLGEMITVEFVTEPEVDAEGNASWTIRAERQVRSNPSIDRWLPSILGSTPENAARIIGEENVLGADPQVQLFPAWWPRLPLLPIQIETSIITP